MQNGKPRKARVPLTPPQAIHSPLLATTVQPKTNLEGRQVIAPVGTVLRQEIRPDMPGFEYVIVQNRNRQRFEVIRKELDSVL